MPLAEEHPTDQLVAKIMSARPVTSDLSLDPSLRFPSSRAKLRAESALAISGGHNTVFDHRSVARIAATPVQTNFVTQSDVYPADLSAARTTSAVSKSFGSKTNLVKNEVSMGAFAHSGNPDTVLQLKSAEATLKEIDATFAIEREHQLQGVDRVHMGNTASGHYGGEKELRDSKDNLNQTRSKHANSSTMNGRAVRVEMGVTADGRTQPAQSLYQNVLRGASAIAKSSRTPAGLVKIDDVTGRPASSLHHTTKRMKHLLMVDGDLDDDIIRSGDAQMDQKPSLATRLLDSVFAPSTTQPKKVVRLAGDEATRLVSASHARKAEVSIQSGLTLTPLHPNNASGSVSKLEVSDIRPSPSRHSQHLQPVTTLEEHRPDSGSSNTKARGGRMAQIKTAILVEAHGVKEQADRSRSRGNVLSNILALINDDAQAKAEAAERAKKVQTFRYGRAFSANTFQLPPGLAAIVQAKREAVAEQAGRLSPIQKVQQDIDDNNTCSRSGRNATNWMAYNAQRARLYQHLVEADRVKAREVEHEKSDRAQASREMQYYGRMEALELEAETVRGLGKSAPHRWATFVTLISSAACIKQLVESHRQRKLGAGESGTLQHHSLTNDEIMGAEAGALILSDQLVALVDQLKGMPRFQVAVGRFIRQRRNVATNRIHSFLLTVRSASKIQMRCRQLLAHIRLMQRNVRRFLYKRRCERELWDILIQHLIDERVAFTRQITIDYEKEHKRRRVALASTARSPQPAATTTSQANQPNTTTTTPHTLDQAMATDAAALLIQQHGGGEGPGIGGSVPQIKGGRSIQNALLAVRTMMDSTSAGSHGPTIGHTTLAARKAPIPHQDAHSRGGYSSFEGKTEGGKGSTGVRRAGHTGIPLLLVAEATKVLSEKLGALSGGNKSPNVGQGLDPAGATTHIRTSLKIPGQQPLIVYHSNTLSRRYTSLEVQHQVEIMRTRYEQRFLRISPDELFAISCLPAAVARFWRDAQLAVYYSKATFDLPHAERMTIRLPSKYRERLVHFFRERELAVFHQQVGRWREQYKNAKAKYDWERELAAHELKRAKAAGMTMDIPAVLALKIETILPPFPVRRHIPNPTEARFIVLVGYAIQFLEKKALAEAHVAVAERASLKTIEGKAMLEHEKLLIAQRSLSDENISEVFEKLIRPFAKLQPNITEAFATGIMPLGA